MTNIAPGRYRLAAYLARQTAPPRTARFYGLVDYDMYFLRVPETVAKPDTLAEMTRFPQAPELEAHYPRGGERVKGRVCVQTSPQDWFALSQQAGEAEARGRSFEAVYGVRLRLREDREGGREVWSRRVSLRPGGMPFEIPLRGLTPELYSLDAEAYGPGGERRDMIVEEKSAYGSWTYRPAAPLKIIAPYDTLLEAEETDAPRIPGHAVKVGDPYRGPFPKDDVADCTARSIHDMQLFEGRIYVGCGDWGANRGPIDIWSFAMAPGASEPDWRKEFTVSDESVDQFRVCGDTLYVPGIDAKEPGDEWSLGNLYAKEDGTWRKLRTVPNGLHVLDVARIGGRLFVSAGTETGSALFESADHGTRWIRCGHSDSNERFYEIAPVGGRLLVTPDKAEQGAFCYETGILARIARPLFPDTEYEGFPYSLAYRLTSFSNGLVYTARVNDDKPTTAPLFWLRDPDQGAARVGCFTNRFVRDIVVQDGVCSVLSAQRKAADGKGAAVYSAEIHESRDLRAWTRAARFEVPALPKSFERLGGMYYVGLADTAPWVSADPASGSIWRIEE